MSRSIDRRAVLRAFALAPLASVPSVAAPPAPGASPPPGIDLTEPFETRPNNWSPQHPLPWVKEIEVSEVIGYQGDGIGFFVVPDQATLDRLDDRAEALGITPSELISRALRTSSL